MTDKQPEALRLANALDADRTWLSERGLQQQSMAEAAAELRRLHAENEAEKLMNHTLRHHLMSQRAVNTQLLEALEECVEDSEAAVTQYITAYGENFRPQRLQYMRDTVTKARAAISAAKENQHE